MYPGTPPCHDANVRPYAAYLRVYEPLSAFSDAEGRYWSEYAASAARPRRASALDTEQAEALGRLIATPPIAAPRRESVHAYVRWADGVTYICPWQTRLRSWLELARLRSAARPLLSAAFAAGQADEALRDFASWQGQASSLRVFIQSCTWAVPPGWFVPFAPEERWLVLGGASEADGRGPATAAGTRTLSYATAMSQARRRIARALNALRRTSGDALTSPPGARPAAGVTRASPAAGTAWARRRPPWRSPRSAGGWRVPSAFGRGAGLRRPRAPARRRFAAGRPVGRGGVRGHQRMPGRPAGPGQRPLSAAPEQVAGTGVTRSRQLTIRGRLSRFHPLQRYVSLESRSVTHNSGATGATCHRIFAPGGQLVTAGDGNMVSVGHIGHPRQAPPGARHRNNRRIANWSKRRGRRHVCTYTRGRAAVDTGRGRDDVPR